ncbi:MAG TPA: hypothetical protein VF060_23805 [Trebonia sp.]
MEPGVLGFLVVAGMGLILVFLLKNMNKQFKKLGPPPEETDAESVVAGPSDSDRSSESDAAGQVAQPAKAITAGELQDTVQTGDAKQDQKAQGITKRK